jgi:hypothetical protein
MINEWTAQDFVTVSIERVVSLILSNSFIRFIIIFDFLHYLVVIYLIFQILMIVEYLILITLSIVF